MSRVRPPVQFACGSSHPTRSTSPLTPRPSGLMCPPPVGRAAAPGVSLGEESPGSTERRCRSTTGEGDLRESATEKIPLSCGHRKHPMSGFDTGVGPPAAVFQSNIGNIRCSAERRRPPSGGSRGVRVKRWGKSPPRTRQRGRHGKPHREQDRIGAARASAQSFPDQSPGLVARGVRQRASQTNGRHVGREPRHTEPGLQADWRFSPPSRRGAAARDRARADRRRRSRNGSALGISRGRIGRP